MNRKALQEGDLLFEESLSSIKTQAVFLALTILCLALFNWRLRAIALDLGVIVYGAFFIFFLFYLLNFRTLTIRLTTRSLKLTFGLFSWEAPVENIETAELDEIPPLMYYGGAGVHFMMLRGRYRASFNFLEYPRLVVGFRQPMGVVREISFSTCRAEELLRLLRLLRRLV